MPAPTQALRRRHGYLASRRARRLNLRPPGPGVFAPVTQPHLRS